MNNDVKEEKIQVKDLVLIGIMSILLFACMFVVVLILGMNPVTFLFAPAITGIPAGIVMMLLLSKAPKQGTFFLASTVVAVFFLIAVINSIKIFKYGSIKGLSVQSLVIKDLLLVNKK